MNSYIVVFKNSDSNSIMDSTAKIESMGGIVTDKLPIINGIVVEMSQSLADSLESNQDIKYIEKNSEVSIN
ncbi:hypothetical protein BB559_002338 [Furculomyces boomerangus]|uniref:Uncharacterized protein n=2 Tax=Harpellales TaxID=61421 RepID=A0A2T9YW87_9FUNG|nr:hypothetical protein BB559_002338 [Furculomyces boomerangus]PVZ99408.1 hypothetical protein BB558_004570 [Smittium angustum]